MEYTLGHLRYEAFIEAFQQDNLKAAKEHLFASADEGFPKAWYTLSLAYEDYWDLNLPKNSIVSKILCQEAARLGYEEAKFKLEVETFTEGAFDVPKDFQRGVRQARILAEKGNTVAQRFLKSLLNSCCESLQNSESEMNITDDDLEFLKMEIGWHCDLYEIYRENRDDDDDSRDI